MSDSLLEQQLAHWLDQELSPRPLLVGFSGGLDSRVLLTLLASLVSERPGYSLQACHVHHGLSPKADAWAEQCLQVCAQLQVPCEVVRVKLRLGEGVSLEAQARAARYQALAKRLLPGGALVTAHHEDDQLETLLLALKRGAGPRGLAAMPARQPFACDDVVGGELLRPLLAVSRAQLAAWAAQEKLEWVEDESNQDERFDRNFLRARIVPLLRERWPSYAATARRSSELCAEQESLARELAVADLQQCQATDGSLTLAKVRELSLPRRHNLLRHWLRQQSGLVPSREQLLRIWPQVVQARGDAMPRLHWQGGDVCRYADRLYLVSHRLPELPVCLPLRAEGGRVQLADGRLWCWQTLIWDGRSDGQWVRLPQQGEIVTLRFGVVGSLRARPMGRQGSRELKKLWQEYEVAPWLRGRVPLLFYGETLVAALGYFVCQAFVAEPDGAAWFWWQAIEE